MKKTNLIKVISILLISAMVMLFATTVNAANDNSYNDLTSTLTVNDEIYLYDISSNKYVYKVFELSEVLESDLSPIFDYNGNFKQLTLITCNNFNSNRIIVKAKQ